MILRRVDILHPLVFVRCAVCNKVLLAMQETIVMLKEKDTKNNNTHGYREKELFKIQKMP